jgi:hypothetical protein
MEVPSELPFQNSIDSANFLLLSESNTIILLLLTYLAMLSRRVIPALKGALEVASFTFKKELLSLSTTKLAHWTRIFSHPYLL